MRRLQLLQACHQLLLLPLLQPHPPHLPPANLPKRQLSAVTRQAHHMSSPTSRKGSQPHQLRTAAEPRQNRLYNVRLSHIEQVNPSVRLLQLTIPPEVQNEDEDQDQDLDQV